MPILIGLALWPSTSTSFTSRGLLFSQSLSVTLSTVALNKIHQEISELSDKQVYVQIEYLSRVHNKGNFEKIPGHNSLNFSDDSYINIVCVSEILYEISELSDKQVYVQIARYLSRVHNKKSSRSQLSLMIHTSI